MKKVIYYVDELNDEFANDSIQAKVIDESFEYLGGTKRKAGHLFWYKILARPLAYVFLKLWFGHKIVGKKKILNALKKDTIKQNKKGKKGIFLYGNHTNGLADALIPSMISYPKDAYVIVHPNNVSMPVLGDITPSLGALPLPDTRDAARNFFDALEYRVNNKDTITIYPEAHIWPYYTKIRPFKELSFRYPLQYDASVYCFTNVYRKRRYRKVPRIITFIDGPFTVDKHLSNAQKKKELRDKVYKTMVKRSRYNNVEVIKYIKKNDNA